MELTLLGLALKVQGPPPTSDKDVRSQCFVYMWPAPKSSQPTHSGARLLYCLSTNPVPKCSSVHVKQMTQLLHCQHRVNIQIFRKLSGTVCFTSAGANSGKQTADCFMCHFSDDHVHDITDTWAEPHAGSSQQSICLVLFHSKPFLNQLYVDRTDPMYLHFLGSCVVLRTCVPEYFKDICLKWNQPPRSKMSLQIMKKEGSHKCAFGKNSFDIKQATQCQHVSVWAYM